MPHPSNGYPMGEPGRQRWLDDVFTYHPPTPEQAKAYENIRATARELVEVILNACPDCADKSAAIRKVREAVMTANAAIALQEPTR